jgi:hypothetical protein
LIAPGDERRGCLSRSLGCFGIACGFVVILGVAVLFLAGGKTRLIRGGIAPGMTVEQVVDNARGWLICQAYGESPEGRPAEYRVWATGYRMLGAENEHTFATRQEMATALGAELGGHSEWRMTFGYTTLIPKRIYFDVRFSPGGRVTIVSKTRWGLLD